ncbi:hypothetical protein BWQ96_05410 [Gracilariopsis chorda]|uniref:Uncharacterized protein n=1 Tax=Gracilariopsis chorda TaxID=448386 RepID=A0A2V3ISV1_9FLOR|nr:hypothetical protein BWQ96_05410 [Gracilariopsis chorda]|eukprot:PXF44827.1 hypothetical protein BWQ96_05410 [Gracilariopsis chorda]
MNFHSRSSLHIAVFAVCTLNLVHFVQAQATQGVGCVFSDDSCPCSQMEPSGVCMKPDNEGMCLLGECNTGYRCDCLGYTMCKRTKCAMYTAVENVIPSESVPFGCHLTPDAGQCTAFDHMLDTLDAAENALVEASHSNDAASAYTAESYQLVAKAQSDVSAVNEALRSIEPFRDELSDEETDELEKDAEVVRQSATEAAREALQVSLKAAEVNKERRLVADLKKTASKRDKEAKRAKDKLKEAEEKADKEHKECEDCDKLKEEEEKQTKLRKESCSKAGEAAKRAREGRSNSNEGRKRVMGNCSKSAEAKARIESRVENMDKSGKHGRED